MKSRNLKTCSRNVLRFLNFKWTFFVSNHNTEVLFSVQLTGFFLVQLKSRSFQNIPGFWWIFLLFGVILSAAFPHSIIYVQGTADFFITSSSTSAYPLVSFFSILPMLPSYPFLLSIQIAMKTQIHGDHPSKTLSERLIVYAENFTLL